MKIANALRANVVLFTTSPEKAKDAVRLGAKEVVVSKNPAEMKKHLNSFDFILDTVAAAHDINAYLELLKRDATLDAGGRAATAAARERVQPHHEAPPSLPARSSAAFARRRKCSIFVPTTESFRDIELIPIQKVNEAYDRLVRSDVKYRFVIDMKSLA